MFKMCNLYNISVVALVCLFRFSVASRITLKATPTFISPGITPVLNIRCTVTDNSTSGSPIVGRREISDVLHSGLRRQAEADIAHITSIVILRTDHETGANDTVATVTTFDPATAHVDLGKLSVKGTTDSQTPGEKGYLELTWSNPTAHQYGIYTCEVFALNDENHPEESIQSVQVKINEPSTQELLLYVAFLEGRIDSIEQRLKGLQGGVDVQTGVVACTQGTHDYPVVFAKPFNKVPTTITALAGVGSGESFIHTPTIVNLNVRGFTLRCTSFLTASVVWVAL